MSDIFDVLRTARDWNPESGDTTLNATGRIRNRLFAGEAFTGEEAGERFSCTKSLLGTVVQDFLVLGYTFDITDVPSATGGRPKKRYLLTNPGHIPSIEQAEALAEKGRQKRKAKKKKAAAAAKAPSTNGTEPAPEAVPLPVFGSTVEIYHMLDSGTGEVMIGFRDEHTSWTATLLGGAPRAKG